jgi:hypothetical protein
MRENLICINRVSFFSTIGPSPFIASPKPYNRPQKEKDAAPWRTKQKTSPSNQKSQPPSGDWLFKLPKKKYFL